MRHDHGPRVYRQLRPCLRVTARDRGTTVNRFVNGLLYRSLLCERLSEQALEVFPYELGKDQQLQAIARCIESDWSRPRASVSDWAQRFERRVEPFEGLHEISLWYENSVLGVARGLAGARRDSWAKCRRSPGELGGEWLYETVVLNLNRVYVNAVNHLNGNRFRADIR